MTDVKEALQWVERKINLHMNYIDTFHAHEDTHVVRQVKHKTKQCEILEICRSALQRAEKAEGLVRALEKIAARPELQNPERDADWKNCMKWSSHEAKEALSAWKGW